MNPNFYSLQNYFLVAMPLLSDFNFSRAVVYVCAHNSEGAMGVIINRPISGLFVADVFKQMNISLDKGIVIPDRTVYLGGPIQPERGFILHRPNTSWESTLITSSELALTSSQDILHAIGKEGRPSEFMIILGYAGWTAGQLEDEIARNYWLTSNVDPAVLFQTEVDARWRAAAALLGVDISCLSSETGHG